MEYAEEIGALSCHMLFLVDVSRGKSINATQLDRSEYKNTINKIIEKDIDIKVKPTCASQYKVEAMFRDIPTVGSRGCIAGISYCSILSNGDVHICPYTPVKVDSIRERSFDDIWENNEVFLKLRDYSQYKGKCGSCRYIDLCGGWWYIWNIYSSYIYNRKCKICISNSNSTYNKHGISLLYWISWFFICNEDNAIKIRSFSIS